MKDKIFKSLYNNRMLSNHIEIETYEYNLNLLSESFSEEDIIRLCLTFEDKTQNSEVMFGAIHLLESLSSELAYKNTIKNGALSPGAIAAKSSKKVWWQGSCGHEWQSTVASRTSRNGGCPYCSNKKILKGFNDLETINPDLAKEWNTEKNGDLRPSDVSPKSSKKVWWICEFGHEWQATVNDRANGTKCPICRRLKRSS